MLLSKKNQGRSVKKRFRKSAIKKTILILSFAACVWYITGISEGIYRKDIIDYIMGANSMLIIWLCSSDFKDKEYIW